MRRIKLRALTSTDLDKTFKWNNQDDISDLYLGHPFPVNPEIEKCWYDKILTSNFPTTVFGIELVENNLLLGISLLKNINLINRSAEFAIYIGDKEYRGKGLSKEATLETLTFGFHKLGLNRIYLKVLEENEAAINLYLSTGFKQEGVLRKNVFKNNQFKSDLVMAILKDEFNG
jgi:RimJ/RimL family protein N-acetyltransferase